MAIDDDFASTIGAFCASCSASFGSANGKGWGTSDMATAGEVRKDSDSEGRARSEHGIVPRCVVGGL